MSGMIPQPIAISTRNGHHAETAYAAALVRLCRGHTVQKTTHDKLLKSDPPEWGDVATFIEASAGVTDPVQRVAMVGKFLNGIKPPRQDGARAILDAFKAAWAGPDPGDEPEPFKPRSSFVDAIHGITAFNATEFRLRWLIERVIVAGQPGVVAAPRKTMKTSCMADLAVSLAAGLPFLGEFRVPEGVPVLLLSGESGGFTLQETIRRVCDAKGISPESMEGRLFIGDDLPQLGNDEDLAELTAFLEENGIQVVIVDPLYLCLLQGSIGKRLDPSNLFDVGPLLLAVSRACMKAGATPLLVHHFRKNGADPNDLPELEEMAYAGIQEFARQWVLLKRRERYEPGSGIHKLWLVVGGSAGHSGEWAMDIDEGTMDLDFTGRRWEVSIRRASEERMTAEDVKQAEKERQKTEKEIQKTVDDNRIDDAVLAFIKTHGGATTGQIRAAVAGAGNNDKAKLILERLILKGLIVSGDVQSRAGKGTTNVKGWLPTRNEGGS
jgi:hypothetical protein